MGTICRSPFMRKFWGHLAEVSSVIPRVEMAAEGRSFSRGPRALVFSWHTEAATVT